MSQTSVIENLYSQLEERGLKGRVVPIRHLQDLQSVIEDRHTQGSFDEDFYQERLKFFSFKHPDDLPTAASLIVVAVPRPQTRVSFTWNGKTRALTLPPTYCGYTRVTRQTADLLNDLLCPAGYRVAGALLPDKSLAAHSGLAEYGRNNIGYVPGMGSFYQATVYFSDLPCTDDPWREPRMMARCETCRACLIQCPTGAITEERFLLHAERCIVYHNERSFIHPFPAWIDPAAHNCLVGCMICQQFCPEDKAFLGWFEDNEEFSQQETTLLMRGVTADQLPAGTRAKLERLELLDSLENLPRNLGVFFNAKEQTP